MDQDGHNHRYLTSGLDLVLTPRFSPTANEIAYLNYFNDEPNVYLFELPLAVLNGLDHSPA